MQPFWLMFIEGHETTDFVLFIDFTLCDLISRNDQQYESWLVLFKYILITDILKFVIVIMIYILYYM